MRSVVSAASLCAPYVVINSRAVLLCLFHVARAYVQNPYKDNVLFYSVSEYPTRGLVYLIVLCECRLSKSWLANVRSAGRMRPRRGICGSWSRE